MKKTPKRKPVNLMSQLPESLRQELKFDGVTAVKVKYENCVVRVESNKESNVASKEVHRAVKRLENKQRKYITSVLARYYSTKNLKKLLMLENEIDKLERSFWDSYAWFVTRDWEFERIRDVKEMLKYSESSSKSK